MQNQRAAFKLKFVTLQRKILIKFLQSRRPVIRMRQKIELPQRIKCQERELLKLMELW